MPAKNRDTGTRGVGMRYIRLSGIAVMLATIGAGPALATEYDEGSAAYQRQQYDKSFRLLRAPAENGDARAQYILGRQYQFGQGVKSDKAEAYYWYRRAEAGGHVEAKLFRHLLETHWNITAEERSRGERRYAVVARGTVAKADAKTVVKADAKIGPAAAASVEKFSALARASDARDAENVTPAPSPSNILTPARRIETPDSRTTAALRDQPPERRRETAAPRDDDDDDSTPIVTKPQYSRGVAPPIAYDDTAPETPPPTFGYRMPPPHWGPPPVYGPVRPPIVFGYPQPNYYGYGYRPNSYWHPGWRRFGHFRHYNY